MHEGASGELLEVLAQCFIEHCDRFIFFNTDDYNPGKELSVLGVTRFGYLDINEQGVLTVDGVGRK